MRPICKPIKSIQWVKYQIFYNIQKIIYKAGQDMKEGNSLENLDKQTIEQIISNIYNKDQLNLDLSNKDYMWKSALSNRDWSSIKILNLMYCHLKDADISILVSYKWPCLQKLLLSSNSLTTPGIQTLLKHDWPNLSSLAINFNEISNQGFEQLLLTKNMPKIKQFSFEHNKVNPNGFIKCPQSFFCFLQTLKLSNSLMGDNGVKYLVKCDLSTVQIFQIYNCDLAEEGACHLMKANFKKLKNLSIHYNNFNRDAYWYMNRIPGKQLTSVVVKNIDPVNLDSYIVSDFPHTCKINYVIISRSHPKKNKGIEDMMERRFKTD